MHLIADPSYHTLADTWFVELVHDRKLRNVLGARWPTAASPEALAAGAVARVSYADSGTDELVVEVGGAIAQVIFGDGAAAVRIAAPTREEAERARARLRELLPPVAADGVEVVTRLWWWDGDRAAHLARPLAVPQWDEIAGNYGAQTAAGLARLVAWRAWPPRGGRLIVCHGPSGTGKTHAVQMLAGAWRAWADLHVVSDPERFLASPDYLMAIAGAGGGSDDGRWRVALLEDAGSELAGGATHSTVGRLLNVCDGVLARALRLLVLVTTNEPATRLDAALRRPGRQLAEVRFTPLEGDEIERWCGERGLAVPARDCVTLADLYGYAEGAEPRVAARGVGFAPAVD